MPRTDYTSVTQFAGVQALRDTTKQTNEFKDQGGQAEISHSMVAKSSTGTTQAGRGASQAEQSFSEE